MKKNHVNRKLTAILASFLLPFILAVPVVNAAAPVTIKGTWVFNFTTTSSQTVGPNTITTESEDIVLTGGLSGDCIGTDYNVFFADGSFITNGECTFTGTIAGSGPGTASLTFATTSSQPAFVTITQGTGGLAGVQAQVTAFGDGTYSGRVV